jgi:hypothetical protein
MMHDTTSKPSGLAPYKGRPDQDRRSGPDPLQPIVSLRRLCSVSKDAITVTLVIFSVA